MPEFITEEEFHRLIAKRLSATHTHADADTDRVDGSLSDVIEAVLEVSRAHGPVMLGD